MERNVPEYVSASVPVPAHRQGSLVQEHLPQLLRHFPVCRLLPQAGWANDWLCQPHGGAVGVGGRRTALFWALLLRAGDAWHADRAHALRGGHLDLWNYGRIFDPRNPDGPVAGWLGGRGRRHCHRLHHEGPGPDLRILYSVIALVWLYCLGWVAIKGIHYVAQVAKYLNWIPFLMILIVLWANRTRNSPVPAAAPGTADRLSECAPGHHRLLRHRGRGRHRFRHEQSQPEGRCSRRDHGYRCRRHHCRRRLGSFCSRLPGPECRTGQATTTPRPSPA